MADNYTFTGTSAQRIARVVQFVEKNLMGGDAGIVLPRHRPAPTIQFLRCIAEVDVDGLYPAVIEIPDDAASQTWESTAAALTPSSTDTGAETVTFASAHGWGTGTAVSPDATGGGLTVDVVYYVRATSTTAVSFHTTQANAEANTSPVNLTASITAEIREVNAWLYFPNDEAPTAESRYGGKLVQVCEDDGLPIFAGLFAISSGSGFGPDLSYYRTFGTGSGGGENWYDGRAISSALINATVAGLGTGGWVFANPFIAPRGGTLDRIGFNVMATGDSTERAVLGIYEQTSDTDPYPGDLLFNSAEFTGIVSTGVKSENINVPLVANKLYWLVIWYDAHGGSTTALRAGTGGWPLIWGCDSDISFRNGCLFANNTYSSTLPDPFSSFTSPPSPSTASSPGPILVAVRYSSF